MIVEDFADLPDAAKEAWQRVLEVAPGTNQARAAEEALTQVVAELEAAASP